MKSKIILLISILFIISIKVDGQCPRETVINDYNSIYLGSTVSNSQLQWTGDYSSCTAGTISVLAQENTLARVNYFRSLVGVGEVNFDATLNSNCQKVVLMMGANGTITHNPPTEWLCYTSEGATGAHYSNLCYGLHSSAAIDLYINDTDVNAGHRRWVLYSRASDFGHGSTPMYDALWCIITTPGPVDTRNIAYPSAGFFPAPLVPAKWSFGKHNADFRNAVVSMTDQNNETVQLTVATVVTGYGDNTIVWTPQNIIKNSSYDITYTVKIENVKVDGIPQTYIYDVTICQPVHPPQCPEGYEWSDADCKCSTVTGIEDNEQRKPSVSITNPFYDIMEIRVQNNDVTDFMLSVIDITGKEVENREIQIESISNYSLNINTSGWKKGIYFVILNCSNGNKSVNKVIKY